MPTTPPTSRQIGKRLPFPRVSKLMINSDVIIKDMGLESPAWNELTNPIGEITLNHIPMDETDEQHVTCANYAHHDQPSLKALKANSKVDNEKIVQ